MIKRVYKYITHKLVAPINSRLDDQAKFLKELYWANIYHDSIRDKQFLKRLSLHIGRWAVGYPFLYLLNRILSEMKPQTILELGLGESTKVISTYLEKDIIEAQHIIIENDKEWKNFFEASYKLSSSSNLNILPIEKKIVHGYETVLYQNLYELFPQKFELYIIDGPKGSPRYSRYNIMDYVDKMVPNENFIILLDDTNRQGEKDTLHDISCTLGEKGIVFHLAHFEGEKTTTMITSDKYKYFTSL